MAEFAGTLLLMLVVVGVGLTTRRGSPTFGVIAEALGVAGALVGLIIAFGQVSGGHFNPLITFLQWVSGLRDLNCTIVYVAAQVAGGIVGALTAALMFWGLWAAQRGTVHEAWTRRERVSSPPPG